MLDPDSSDATSWLSDLPTLRRPVLIAAFEGWNDAGDAATIAANHLRERWDAQPVAEIEAENYFDFTTTRPHVQLDDDRRREVVWPTNRLHAARLAGASRDAVLLVGLEPQLRWRSFCVEILSVAARLGVDRVVTLGALLADVPHSRPVEVYGASDDESLSVELALSPSSYEGPTGIVGVLASLARDHGLPTASFWAAVPAYAPGAPSPKAALALVHRVCAALDTSTYATDLEIAAAAYEREMSALIGEDEDTAAYVADLEAAWDDESTDSTNRFSDGPIASHDLDESPLADDPETLVAEVERFLRDAD